MRSFAPQRALEIIASQHGSGYGLGGRLVLTCAHLFAGVGPCQVRDKTGFGSVDAQVVWMAPQADIALVELPDTLPAWEPVGLGQLPPAQSGSLPFQMAGFPRWAFTQGETGNQSGRRAIPGQIHLGDTSPDGLLVVEPKRTPSELEVAQAPAQQQSPWQGTSGAAVVCDGLVVAVLHWHQNPKRPASLEATPLTLVTEDQDWQEHLRQHGIDPTLETVWVTSTDTAPKPVGIPSNLPLSGVVQFVGREEVLKQVHEKLQATSTVAITSVSGMGGVGKTELVLQYAYQHLRTHTYPGGLCWLNVRAEDVGLGLLAFARIQLGLPEPPDTPETLPERVQWVCRRWPGEPILVVLDDVTDYKAIQPYLHLLDYRFRVLITTRLKLLAPAQQLELEVLTEEAALELLRVLVDDPGRVDCQAADARRLCAWLGYLPLGLELVGRYLARKLDLSLAALLERLEAKRLAAPALERAEQMTAQRGVAAAFELSWEELPPEARILCGLLSLFALAPIPWPLVEQVVNQYQPTWDLEALEACRDDHLLGCSLLTRQGDQRYELHQLIREFFAAKLTQELCQEAPALKQAVATTLTNLAKTIPPTVTQADIGRVQTAIPHLEAVATDLTAHLTDDDYLWPYVGLARFYAEQSLWQPAEDWYRRCLTLAETRLGADHPDVATSLNNLAGLYRALGRYAEAEPSYVRSLEIVFKTLGQDHPSTQTVFNNFVTCLQAAVAAGQAGELSDHPLTQAMLAMLTEER
ncbi:MAG: tetratricopeptide repeat protein [Cyanobacteria bacterium]|nr:tetratricopeptide repeat protein [Cyanobacteriota bacterium]MDW8199658.1 tetratricopeptide repeat protein [Cyanobacteriota bacterium SKYGB_h_bin112]